MKSAYELKMKPLDDLVPYSQNARTHTPEQIDQVAASIKEFGFNNPILLDSKNGIIAGHCRSLAARKLGMEKVPTITLDHLNDAERRAYILADNRLALNAGWDDALLASELQRLDGEIDLSLLGFGADELSGLLDLLDQTEGLTDEDEAPEAPETPVTALGDVWLLSNHRLMCGDSVNFESVGKLMDAEIADMVFTDPPYGISYQSQWRTKKERFDVIESDELFVDVAPTVEKFSSGWVFVWTSWKVITEWLEKFKTLGYPTNQIIWFKGGGGIGDLKKTFASDYETALVWNRGAVLTGNRIGSVWKLEKDSPASYRHPTQKPVGLAVEAIEKTTKIENVVLDLFGGSGSTLIACEKTRRRCCMMELDPKYCDVIVKRWQDFTGKQAVLEESGKTYNELAL